MSSRTLLLTAWTLASSPLLAATAPAATARPAAPRLAVMLAIDGLNYDRLMQYRPWYVAGLKRLLDEGQDFSETNYRHFNTETGPGHSSLGTGAPPRVTGVVSNEWHVREADGSLRMVNCAEPQAGQPGPGNLRVPTLADRLVAANPGARVVSLSGKNRSALLMAGRDPRHAVYWYDYSSGRFVTSAAYDASSVAGARVGALVKRFNGARAGSMLPGRFGLLWKKLAPLVPVPGTPLALPTPVPNLSDYQIPAQGVGFDHDLARDPYGYFRGFYISPFVDELLADLVLEVLEDPKLALGRGGTPDLLAISFSAQDTVSHSHGAESEENLDTLRRLDLQLGRLFEAFDRLLPGRVLLGLSADHGFTPIPEVHHREQPGSTAGRLVDGDRTTPNLVERLNRLLAEELCLPPGTRSLAAVDGLSLVYNRPVFPVASVAGRCGEAGLRVSLNDVDRVLPGVVTRFYGDEVSAVYRVSERDTWRAEDPLTELLRNDLDLERSGDAFLILRPYVILHWDPARGSGHGSHHRYDTHVPLVFWGGPFKPGRSTEATTPYDLAPTLAEALKVSLPDAVGVSRLPH